MPHQLTHGSSCIIIRCRVKVCHVSRVTWLYTVVFTVTQLCLLTLAASLEVDMLFYSACATSFRLYQEILAPFPSSWCLVLKTALLNILNPCTGIWVEQLMNIMMKFSQNILTPGTQPSFCGANKGEGWKSFMELRTVWSTNKDIFYSITLVSTI